MVYKNKIHEPSGTIKYIKDFSSVILSLPNYNTSVLSTRSTALVTGGSSGLGFELAMELAKRVNKVIVADIQSFPTFAQEECNNIFYYQCDITSLDEIKKLKKATERDHGNVDILVNNAGVAHIKKLEHMTNKEVKQLIDINLIGAYRIINTFAADMMNNEEGFIIDIASVLGELTPARLTSYGASKGAMIGFHKSMCRRFSSLPMKYNKPGIKTLLVCPGKIQTNMFIDVPTPSKLLAPDIIPSQLALAIISAMEHNHLQTLNAPYYVNLVPFFKTLSWPYRHLLKHFSGMDHVTSIQPTTKKV
ncbi:short-chain dehydrogenase/reductase SPAR_D01230 [Saccharomyces paradoxus]|uniref:Short-chain dehydrogenase/reductase n=1 Tax=Saccharomyces paradoxus TaxID=27291 RepID=A0A8B8UNC4_SACPA|nr:uncharacterized protein SPAR_D01230 [Saccharomyces paradoxus]QHS72124.1 hypothetical protein SPAR_D01230 [Saccharomyces paradoxus]